MSSIPGIATFPRDDLVFAALVRTAVRDDPTLLRSADRLQSCLRRWHTRVAVRPQVDLAGFGAGPTWYVYRDGRAGVVLGRDWWLEPGVAHVSFGRDGYFRTANAAAEGLVGRPVVGSHWSELVPSEARSDSGAWLWELLDRRGEAQSVFDLPLVDGRRRVIEYRTTHCREQDVYESYWRELAVVTTESPIDGQWSLGSLVSEPG